MGLGVPARPKLGTSDPRVRLRGRIAVSREFFDLFAWVEAENQSGRHVCQCGCGERIRVLPRHHWHGIPKHLRAHHPMMTKEVTQIREAGLLTATDAARALGIGKTTLARLEGELFEPVPRQRKRAMSTFTPEQVEQIRVALQAKTGFRPEPALLYMDGSESRRRQRGQAAAGWIRKAAASGSEGGRR